MATQADRDNAKAEVVKFAANPATGAFKKIDRGLVAKGLQVRIDDPIKINQGTAGLCPSAAVVYAIARDKPVEYAKAVMDLYDTGKAKIGKWDLKPGTDLKEYSLPSDSGIDPADWIPMASIRDSENWFIDYEATTDDGGAWGGEVADWLKKAGYTDVIEEWNYFFCKNEAHLRKGDRLYNKDNYNVCLLINTKVFDEKITWSMQPNHWVVLAGDGVTFSVDANKKITVRVCVFTYGDKKWIPSETGYIALKDFLDNYYGFVACKL
jgi:hypothetical protein